MFYGRSVEAEDKIVCGKLYCSENAEIYIEYVNQNGERGRTEVMPLTVRSVQEEPNRSR